MIELTFSKAGCEDIVLTEDDLFDFRFERGCFSGDTFELGGVSAKSIYMIIDNNEQRFPRGAFANSRVRLDIDGHFCGYFNAELPKRRNGVIELTAYDDMIKLDMEFPTEVQFPQTFISVYAHCLLAAGIADHFLIENGDIFVLNALFNNGVISHEYTDYIYANSCRNVVSGMAEWNGGFAYINDDGKLQVDVFSKEVSRTFYSGELTDFDYSDETVVFSKIKTSQKNKTYEMGDDSGYTLVINNQYISYGLDDADFETYLGFIYDYYKGFSLTPMSFTLAEPDFSLKIGDRISVVDEEENVTVTGNISEISVKGDGELDSTIIAALMALDYITGILCGIAAKALSSEVGFKGLVKKLMVLVIIAVGHLVDNYIIGTGSALMTAVILFFAANEGISIIENAATLGLPVPQKLRDILEQLRKEDKHDDN